MREVKKKKRIRGEYCRWFYKGAEENYFKAACGWEPHYEYMTFEEVKKEIKICPKTYKDVKNRKRINAGCGRKVKVVVKHDETKYLLEDEHVKVVERSKKQ